ncbi:hypothetical protein Bca4012_066050 [Brassica carinata]
MAKILSPVNLWEELSGVWFTSRSVEEVQFFDTVLMETPTHFIFIAWGRHHPMAFSQHTELPFTFMEKHLISVLNHDSLQTVVLPIAALKNPESILQQLSSSSRMVGVHCRERFKKPTTYSNLRTYMAPRIQKLVSESTTETYGPYHVKPSISQHTNHTAQEGNSYEAVPCGFTNL